jgi:hypothetical protein
VEVQGAKPEGVLARFSCRFRYEANADDGPRAESFSVSYHHASFTAARAQGPRRASSPFRGPSMRDLHATFPEHLPSTRSGGIKEKKSRNSYLSWWGFGSC